LTIVSVSNWLSGKVKDSFLKNYPSKVIQNGIDLNTFYPKKSRVIIDNLFGVKDKFVILGVVSTWSNMKGLGEFIKLNELLDSRTYAMVLVGLSKSQITKLPISIIGIERTENIDRLADLYSGADVFLNPTFEDTFPTTNLESIACGTPVITYKTGGSPESINKDTGIVVDKGDILGLISAIEQVKKNGRDFYTDQCLNYAINNFDKKIQFNDYFELYNKILSDNHGE
jgi:putative colanic acid biosynthesis glycosyltransferase